MGNVEIALSIFISDVMPSPQIRSKLQNVINSDFEISLQPQSYLIPFFTIVCLGEMQPLVLQA